MCVVGELDQNQIAAPAALDGLGRTAVDQHPAAERVQRGVDPLEVLDDLRSEFGGVDVGDGVGGHFLLLWFALLLMRTTLWRFEPHGISRA